MAERRGWTTVVRRWGLRWFDLKLGRAPVDYKEASARALVAWGGRVGPGHGDGGGGGASARRCAGLELTELERRALAGAGSCGEDGDAVAVMEKQLGVACAVNDDGGAAGARWLCLRVLRTAKEEQKTETEGADGSGRLLA